MKPYLRTMMLIGVTIMLLPVIVGIVLLSATEELWMFWLKRSRTRKVD